MKQPISHFERCNTRFTISELPQSKPTVRKVRVKRVNPITKEIYVTVEHKTVNRAEEMKPYRVSDFSISNLAAIGAQLKPTIMSADPHTCVDNMAQTLHNLSNQSNNN